MDTRTRKPWTPAEDDHLREMAKVPGKRLSDMAAVLNRSPEAVRSRAESIGLQLPKQKRRGSILA